MLSVAPNGCTEPLPSHQSMPRRHSAAVHGTSSQLVLLALPLPLLLHHARHRHCSPLPPCEIAEESIYAINLRKLFLARFQAYDTELRTQASQPFGQGAGQCPAHHKHPTRRASMRESLPTAGLGKAHA